MKRLWWVVSLLFVSAMITVGCSEPVAAPTPPPMSEEPSARHLQGMKSPRLLTEEEKERVTEIALNTPEALKQLEKFSHYDAKLSWIAIVWENSEVSVWRGIAYDWEKDPNLSLVPETAEFYSQVIINFGEPPQWQVYVAVNPDTGKAVFVQENPFRTGPTPAVESHPKGMESLRWLTEAEKAEVIEIALNTPEAVEARETYGYYKTGLSWVAIKWQGSFELWGLDYEMVDKIPDNVPESAEFYSRVEIYFGEPEQVLLRVAVNPDTGEVANVEAHGLKILPK